MIKYSIYLRFEGRKTLHKLDDVWIEGTDLEDAKSRINEDKLKENYGIAWGIPISEIVYKKLKNQNYYDK